MLTKKNESFRRITKEDDKDIFDKVMDVLHETYLKLPNTEACWTHISINPWINVNERIRVFNKEESQEFVRKHRQDFTDEWKKLGLRGGTIFHTLDDGTINITVMNF